MYLLHHLQRAKLESDGLILLMQVCEWQGWPKLQILWQISTQVYISTVHLVLCRVSLVFYTKEKRYDLYFTRYI